jgi:outer membrane assembly lipoprotein YfiO
MNTKKLYASLFFITITSLTIVAETNLPSQSLDIRLPSTTNSKTKKSRMRKHKNEQERKIYTYRDMTYDELSAAKDEHIKNNNSPSAIKYLEHMISLCNDVTKRSSHHLEIADLIFKEQQYQKSAQKYAEFAILYPGHNDIERVLTRAIESNHNCQLSFDRDQTKTEETLKLAEAFLKRDDFTQYRDLVTEIRDECIKKLVESEFNVCAFYLKQGKLSCVERRIASIKTTWLPKFPDAQNTINEFEADIALQKSKTQPTIVVADNDKAKHMADRF